MTTDARASAPARPGRAGLLRLLGPAFVAAIAYVDPGNVAANLTAGAGYGYLLLWVLVAANGMAVPCSTCPPSSPSSAAAPCPRCCGTGSAAGPPAFWGQAELVAIATDLAEVIGGAVAL